MISFLSLIRQNKTQIVVMIIVVNSDNPDAQPVKASSKAESFIRKKIEDKRLIRDYIKQGKDLSELTTSRGIEFVSPLIILSPSQTAFYL